VQISEFFRAARSLGNVACKRDEVGRFHDLLITLDFPSVS
jgi:hypothetical protein